MKVVRVVSPQFLFGMALIASLTTSCVAPAKRQMDPKQAFTSHRGEFEQIVQSLAGNKKLQHLLVYPPDSSAQDWYSQHPSKTDPYAEQGLSPDTVNKCRKLIKDVGLTSIEAMANEVDFSFVATTPSGQTARIAGGTIKYINPASPQAQDFAAQSKQPESTDVTGGTHKLVVLDSGWYLQNDDFKI
jgi:hypothetical protein